MNATTLSALVWGGGNGLNPDPNIEWPIIPTADPYRPGRGPCQLCIGKKICINEQAGKSNILNKRKEIGQTCRHKARHKLAYL